jgi:hypothetical protein
VLLALLLLAGCQKSFDERYADAQKKIREQAASIDKDLSDKASEAAMGQAEATPVLAPSSMATSPPPS